MHKLKITQIQFRAPCGIGADALASVFVSLPRKGGFSAWDSQAAAAEYCAAWVLRPDATEEICPWVPEQVEDGVTTIVTPASGHEVAWRPSGELWTVGFGNAGSIRQAGRVLAALPPGVDITSLAVDKYPRSK